MIITARFSLKLFFHVSNQPQEIYQEELRDLLVDSEQQSLKLRDHGDQGVVVRGLSNEVVDSIPQVHFLLGQAMKRRTTSATKMNERSSRSHAICTIAVTTTSSSKSPSGRSGGGKKKKLKSVTAKLTLVDLAGSERIKETGVEGVQKQESININKDLFVLGKVVSALSERANKGSGVHVPYRDSKLTRLLRDSLGGTFNT